MFRFAFVRHNSMRQMREVISRYWTFSTEHFLLHDPLREALFKNGEAQNT